MTQQRPITAVQNIWFDSEQVDAADLTLEQQYNTAITSAIVNNQFGSGIIPLNLEQNIIFDSSLASGLLDGMAISAQHQPSDSNLGNQLQISLMGSAVAGQKSVKVAIIGLDFQGNLQYDTFTFRTNESQYTQKHYAAVLLLLFNDFIGTEAQSFNLGGRIVIAETNPYTVSRSPLTASQDVQPNIFFRDFFTANNVTLQTLLTNALPLYNISSLNIQTGILQNQIIAAGDVTTQIGEKFLANANNIQKVSLLLSVQNSAPGQATNLVWSGDLIISIYPLQSAVNCITDIIPNLPIDFSPYNIPLAQVSFTYNTLQAQGMTLDGTPQPIDFVFSNTPIATGSVSEGSYYAVTVKRAGAASTCDILIGVGVNQGGNSRVTSFSPASSAWVDIPEQDLWFRVFSDAVKVSDGQAYEGGQGLVIPKTIINPLSNAPEDYSLSDINFSGSSNTQYAAVLSSQIQQSGIVQDQRTGDPINSQQQTVPNIQLLNPIDLSNLEATSEPLILGLIEDKNVKSINNTPILASFHAWTFVENTIVLKMIDDVTDPRYDPNVLALVSYLEQGNLFNAQIIPDIKSIGTNPYLLYRISSATLSSMIYGDVDGDGQITENDLALAESLIGANLNSSPPLLSQISMIGGNTTVVNGYYALTQPFASILADGYWQVINPNTNAVLAAGLDGVLVVNPNNGALANLESLSTNFSLISNIAQMQLVIYGNGNPQNNGAFQILTVDATSNNIIDLQKILITPASIQQIFRADIDGNMQITTEDGYLIENYLNKVPPFPATSLPASKIGTPFNCLILTLDPWAYLDPDDSPPTILNRTDDYSNLAANRATALHTSPDILVNDGYMQNYPFLSQPLPFNIIPQFTWASELIVCSSNGGKLIPTVFTAESGDTVPQCVVPGVISTAYNTPSSFDPGVINSFFPNNIIIGAGGNLLNPNGTGYKVDFEIGNIILEIPPSLIGVDTTINVFNAFVASYNNTPWTQFGYPAMKYSNCSLVQPTALVNNQVRFGVAVVSFSPNLDGYYDGYYGEILDGNMGVSLNPMTGQLTLNFANLLQVPGSFTLNTKIQIQVFLKESGFNNPPLFVNSTVVANLLNINTV
jgi:hypothetical protein